MPTLRTVIVMVLVSCLSATARAPVASATSSQQPVPSNGTSLGETPGWVDHVVTPGGAFALLVAEDALDRYFVQWFGRRVGNRGARATLRVILNPSRALANTAEMRPPWERVNRPLSR